MRWGNQGNSTERAKATRSQGNCGTDLMGDESLDVEEVGIGLDGAENMGQDGDRGDVGLAF